MKSDNENEGSESSLEDDPEKGEFERETKYFHRGRGEGLADFVD